MRYWPNRGQKSVRNAVRPIEDALPDDAFQRSRGEYLDVKTVSPFFSVELTQSLEGLLDDYRLVMGDRLPAAWQAPRRGLSFGPGQSVTFATNRAERLRLALWLFERLETVETDAQAINQLACALEFTERLARQNRELIRLPYLPDARLMKLPLPLPERVGKQRVLVSYGVRHVILFQENGAVQIQKVLQPYQKLDYAARSENAELVVLSKAGANGLPFHLTD